MSHSAFELWDNDQKNLVKAYCDEHPDLSDSEMVIHLYTQREVGFWPITEQEDTSTQDRANDQTVLNRIAEYGVLSNDVEQNIIEKAALYIQGLPDDDQAAALIESNDFWFLWASIGYITEVALTYTFTVTPEVLASDIQEIRAM